MPDPTPINNPPPPPSPPAPPPAPAPIPEEKKPAIRTMQHDTEELLKTTQPSWLKNLGEEADQAHKIREGGEKRKKLYLFAAAGGVVLIFLAVAFGYFWLTPSRPPEVVEPPKIVAPAPLLVTEASRTVSVKTIDRAELLRLMEDSYKETEREGTAKRILIKLADGPRERFATLADFFELYRMSPPKALSEMIDSNPTLFFYYGASGPRFGLATKVKDYGRAFAAMLSWEEALVLNFEPLFFGEKTDSFISPQFEDRTYRNIDWRFMKISQEKDLGVAYTIFPAKNILVITTSKAALETVINRLFDNK